MRKKEIKLQTQAERAKTVVYLGNSFVRAMIHEQLVVSAILVIMSNGALFLCLCVGAPYGTYLNINFYLFIIYTGHHKKCNNKQNRTPQSSLARALS